MSHDKLAPDTYLAMRTNMRGWQVIWVCILALLLLVACGSAPETTNNAAVQITLLFDNAGSPDGTVGVQLRAADQAPINDATVEIEGNMNHAGMVPVLTEAVRDSDDGARDGVYHVPFEFSMLGDWIITVEATLADGSRVTQDIQAAVTEAGIQIQDGN